MGLAKERDFKYKCGGGDATKHFEPGTNCEDEPWGAQCSSHKKNNDWTYDGAYVAKGEAQMLGMFAQGISMMVGFIVYENFMSHPAGQVYSSHSGSKKGGHAVALIGYGAEGGTKYWHMQNSWGTKWGSKGMVKFGRGNDLAGVESMLVTIFSGWVTGGHKDPCFESGGTGLSSGGKEVMCSDCAKAH